MAYATAAMPEPSAEHEETIRKVSAQMEAFENEILRLSALAIDREKTIFRLAEIVAETAARLDDSSPHRF